jgi:hypothetical protein
MRNLKWLAVAALSLAAYFGAPPAEAATPSLGLELTAAPQFLEVAVRCGRHAHYVRGHRGRNHRWIRGRCVRDRRR